MGLHLPFLTNLPAATFIQRVTFIPDSRVLFWRNLINEKPGQGTLSTKMGAYESADGIWDLGFLKKLSLSVRSPC